MSSSADSSSRSTNLRGIRASRTAASTMPGPASASRTRLRCARSSRSSSESAATAGCCRDASATRRANDSSIAWTLTIYCLPDSWCTAAQTRSRRTSPSSPCCSRCARRRPGWCARPGQRPSWRRDAPRAVPAAGDTAEDPAAWAGTRPRAPPAGGSSAARTTSRQPRGSTGWCRSGPGSRGRDRPRSSPRCPRRPRRRGGDRLRARDPGPAPSQAWATGMAGLGGRDYPPARRPCAGIVVLRASGARALTRARTYARCPARRDARAPSGPQPSVDLEEFAHAVLVIMRIWSRGAHARRVSPRRDDWGSGST